MIQGFTLVHFLPVWIMLTSLVVTYGICALLTLSGIHKKEILCQFKTLSAPSEVQVLWSKQQRRNEPIFSCIWFCFCFLVFSKWWGKPASSACFQFQGRRLQPNVQQGKIWEVFRSYQAMYSSVCLHHGFAAMWARTTPS